MKIRQLLLVAIIALILALINELISLSLNASGCPLPPTIYNVMQANLAYLLALVEVIAFIFIGRLSRVSGYDAYLLFALILFAIAIIVPGQGGESLGCGVLAISGFSVQSPLIHNNYFTAMIGQATGTNWINASMLFVPYWAAVPSAGPFCPPPGSNTITSGISCAKPSGVNMASGLMQRFNFTFSSSTTQTQQYWFSIWAMYQTAGGKWNESEIGSGLAGSV